MYTYFRDALVRIMPRELRVIIVTRIDEISGMKGDDLDPIELVKALSKYRNYIDTSFEESFTARKKKTQQNQIKQVNSNPPRAPNAPNPPAPMLALPAPAPLPAPSNAPETGKAKQTGKRGREKRRRRQRQHRLVNGLQTVRTPKQIQARMGAIVPNANYAGTRLMLLMSVRCFPASVKTSLATSASDAGLSCPTSLDSVLSTSKSQKTNCF